MKSFSYAQSPSGLIAYDTARWLRPPPRSNPLHKSAGLGILRQTGHSTDVSGPQESLVRPGPDFQLVFLQEATPYEGFVEGRRLRPLRSFAIGISPPGASQRWVTRPTDNCVAHFHISRERLRGLIGDCPVISEYAYQSLRDPETAHLSRAFCSRVRSGSINALEAEAWAVLLARFFRPFSLRPVGRGLAPWQLRRATEWLQTNLDKDVTLAALAAQARLSPFHFAREFKKSTNFAPHAFLIHLRIEKAKALLTETDKSIGDIAAEIGYQDQGYFARLFHREVGATPSAYRRERRR